jgi:hypothetical protein
VVRSGLNMVHVLVCSLAGRLACFGETSCLYLQDKGFNMSSMFSSKYELKVTLLYCDFTRHFPSKSVGIDKSPADRFL